MSPATPPEIAPIAAPFLPPAIAPITAPAPVTVNAGRAGTAPVPNFLASTVASDNCGPVTLSQSPLAGTVVGVGTYVITITATDAAGNTSSATTTFTVNGGGLTFSIEAPGIVDRGRMAKVDLNFHNAMKERINVSYLVRYFGPCDSGIVDSGGPVPVNAEDSRSINVQFHVPKEACTGEYTLRLETFVNGVLIGTASTEVSVTPGLLKGKRQPGHQR